MDIIITGKGRKLTKEEARKSRKVTRTLFIPAIILCFILWIYAIIYTTFSMNNTGGGLALLISGLLAILIFRHL